MHGGTDLEGRLLEIDVAGGARQQEAEVDVDDVALRVQQDVPVVPVLDLWDGGRYHLFGR